jgi:hypothetical protein
MARETSDCLATVSRTKLISGSRKVKSRDPRRSRLCHRNASHRDWIQHYWISLSVLCTGEELLLGARARDRERERERVPSGGTTGREAARNSFGGCAGARERSNDDYCRAGGIYSPTAFAIIGELPLVNCSRYAVGTRALASKHHYCPDTGASARAAVFAVLLVINFAPVAHCRRGAALMRGPDAFASHYGKSKRQAS